MCGSRFVLAHASALAEKPAAGQEVAPQRAVPRLAEARARIGLQSGGLKAQPRSQSRVISAFRTFDTGQFFSAARASSSNLPRSMPGTCPLRISADLLIL